MYLIYYKDTVQWGQAFCPVNIRYSVGRGLLTGSFSSFLPLNFLLSRSVLGY